MKSIKIALVVVVIVAIAVLLGRIVFDRHVENVSEEEANAPKAIMEVKPSSAGIESEAEADVEGGDAEENEDSSDGMQGEESEEEGDEEPKESDEEEEKVEAFDSLTDKWMSNENNVPPTMKDVKEFAEKFRAVPSSRKAECLQRALNLVNDDNVLVLAGILMDKTQAPELVELVFNDVLNRDEEVKEPILKEIYKDKDHPCWATTAWILDVTSDATPQESDAAAPEE